MTTSRRAAFKDRIMRRDTALVPGAYDALSARIVADLGFPALYVTGAGISNGRLGVPDLGLIALDDVADTVASMREVVDLPFIVDADTGFGNAINVRRTVRTLERAGADAIQLEDQVFPKRCGHFAGKDVIPAEEMVQKLRAAADAREDPNLLIVARTDARAVHGIDAALDRAHRFREAGADVIFVEAPSDRAELERIARAIDAPLLLNIVLGGLTPPVELDDARRLGFAVVLYANAALQGAIAGMRAALAALKEAGSLPFNSPLIAPFSERQRLVGKPEFDALEQRYAAKPPPERPKRETA